MIGSDVTRKCHFTQDYRSTARMTAPCLPARVIMIFCYVCVVGASYVLRVTGAGPTPR